jgi:hypothetical protein
MGKRPCDCPGTRQQNHQLHRAKVQRQLLRETLHQQDAGDVRRLSRRVQTMKI